MRSPPVSRAGGGRLTATAAQPAATGTLGYFVLAYALSWAWLIPVAVAGGTIATGRGWPTHLPALLGPLLAAVIITARGDGRTGLRDLGRRMTRVRVPARWWLFALSPVLVLAAVLGVETVGGLNRPSVADFAAFTGVPSRWGLLGVAATVILVNGFGEETGWRGFALPHLQERFRPLTATLVLALLWAGWHLPMFLVVDNFRSFTPPVVVGWVIGLASGAVVLGWLYNRSGGSILLVALWHGTYNLISGTDAATGLLAALSTTLVIGLAVTLVVLEVRASRRGLPSVLGPRITTGS